MPMPQLGEKESRDAYVARFMGDEAMVKEYPDEKQRLAVANSEYEKMNTAKNLSEPIKTVDLDGVEVFMAQAKETPDFSEGDLDAMVASAQELEGEIKPPVFLGHTREAGWPAVGWIKNVRRAGMKLMADLKQVPETVAQWIKSGGYRRVSPEIRINYTSESGKKHPKVLYGLALLGQDVPRLKLLGDLPIPDFAEGNGESAVYQFSVTETKISEGGGSIMADEKKEMIPVEPVRYAELIEAEKRANAASDQEAKILKMSEDLAGKDKTIAEQAKTIEENTKKFAEIARQAKTAKIDAAIVELKRDGKIAPAAEADVKAFAEALDDSEVIEFAAGETPVKATMLGRYLSQLAAAPKVVEFGEQAKSPAPEKGKSEGDADLVEKVMKYAEEHKLSFAAAITKALSKEEQARIAPAR